MKRVLKTVWCMVLIAAMSVTVSCRSDGVAPVADGETDHFHPKGKPPSAHTIEVLEQARATLPFADKRDFEEQEKGFIAAPESKKIMADAGHAAWDMERFEWLTESDDFDSIHPSLVRQSKLNMNAPSGSYRRLKHTWATCWKLGRVCGCGVYCCLPNAKRLIWL